MHTFGPEGNNSIKFKNNVTTEYIPLIKLFEIAELTRDYFNVAMKPYTQTSVKRYIRFDLSRIMFSFYSNSRLRGFQNIRTIAIIMLSVFGMKEYWDISINRPITPPNRRNVFSFKDDLPSTRRILNNHIDVFSLALIKTNQIKKVKFPNNHNYYEIDNKAIKILISKTKLKDPSYMNFQYNKTVRDHLIRQLNRYKGEIEMEVVDDKEIAKYYYNPYSLNVNSISEVIKIDNEIKEQTIPIIKESLII